MITKETIMEAYLFMRKENKSVPSETLEFMKDIALEELQKNEAKNLPIFSVRGSTLPTDEDIKTAAKKHAEWDDGTTQQSSMYGFESGAKWMRNKMQ